MPVFDAGIVIKKARKHDVATPPSLTAKELKKLKTMHASSAPACTE
jgi:hypothetical protein